MKEFKPRFRPFLGEHFDESDPTILPERGAHSFFDESSRDNWGKGPTDQFGVMIILENWLWNLAFSLKGAEMV
jgi:hypothetical protein